MISSIWCYYSRGLDCSRPILLLLLLAGWSLPAGLQRCCCRVNVTLFSRVTLIRKLQSTSDLDHFDARELPCSRVKSRDDPISSRRGDSGVLYSFIYRDNDLFSDIRVMNSFAICNNVKMLTFYSCVHICLIPL